MRRERFAYKRNTLCRSVAKSNREKIVSLPAFFLREFQYITLRTDKNIIRTYRLGAIRHGSCPSSSRGYNHTRSLKQGTHFPERLVKPNLVKLVADLKWLHSVENLENWVLQQLSSLLVRIESEVDELYREAAESGATPDRSRLQAESLRESFRTLEVS